MPAPPGSPAALLASVPAHLGRPIEPSEVVVLGWNPLDDQHVAVATLGLVDAEPREELSVIRQVVVDGAEQAAVVVYLQPSAYGGTDRSWSIGEAIGRFLGAVAARYGLDLIGAVTVIDGRYRSIGCTDPTCCPPEGRPVPALVTGQESAQ